MRNLPSPSPPPLPPPYHLSFSSPLHSHPPHLSLLHPYFLFLISSFTPLISNTSLLPLPIFYLSYAAFFFFLPLVSLNFLSPNFILLSSPPLVPYFFLFLHFLSSLLPSLSPPQHLTSPPFLFFSPPSPLAPVSLHLFSSSHHLIFLFSWRYLSSLFTFPLSSSHSFFPRPP